MDMGEKIKTLREQRGMTLEELGNKIGVGKSTVRKWETGMIANMRRDKIAKVANALGVDPAYLMGWEEKIKPNVYMIEYAQKSIAVELLESLNDEGVRRALDYMEMLQKIYPKEEELLLNAAHERTDIKVTDAMRKHDEDIMDDDDF